VDFAMVETMEVLKALVLEEFRLPVMLKSRTLAYDGRGNAMIKSMEDCEKAFEALGGGKRGKLYAERWVEFKKELAVMVVKGRNGEMRCYPVVESVQLESICHVVMAPARVTMEVEKEARRVAEMVVGCLHGAGVYGVEMFLLEDDSVVVNEIAPRVHNTGHYTIEACHTSQFENHLRAILNLPLGSTAMKVPAAVMINLLGGPNYEAACHASLSVLGATLHLYGKEPRPGRKLGHVTLVGETVEGLVQHHAKGILKLVSPDSTRDVVLTPSSPFVAIPRVSIIMGSDSDLPVMRAAANILREFHVPFELTIVSAHRTPLRLVSFATEAAQRGVRIIIAGAGGAAHLPGMVASLTSLPVIGVPVKGKALDGVDSLYSIVQMPRGVPVACVAVDNAMNAGLLAVRMLGMTDDGLREKVVRYMRAMEEGVMRIVEELDEVGYEDYVP